MSEFNQVQDSGKREEFITGSRRDTREGKGRYDLIPTYPIYRLARHYENGAVKYGEHNWTKGQSISRYLDSAERHLQKYKNGDKDEDHIIACVWNLFSIIQTQEWIDKGILPKELNDKFDWNTPNADKV